jgi:DUF218 domain
MMILTAKELKSAVLKELKHLARGRGLSDCDISAEAPVLTSALKLLFGVTETIDAIDESILKFAASELSGLDGVRPQDVADLVGVALNVGLTQDNLLERLTTHSLGPSLATKFRIQDSSGAHTVRQKVLPASFEAYVSFLIAALENCAVETPRYYEPKQVALLNWDEVPSAERGNFLKSFLSQGPSHQIPKSFRASDQSVKEACSNRPIDLKVLGELLEIANVPSDEVCLEWNNLDDVWSFYLFLESSNESIASSLALATSGLDDSQKEKVRNLYQYLCFEDRQVTRLDSFNMDLVVVPGARKAMTYRIDQLVAELQRMNAPTLLFSGLGPTGTEMSALVSEADAMYEYFLGRCTTGESRRVIRDRSAVSSTQVATNVVHYSRQLAGELSRPIRIGIITNPYHMRRMVMLLDKAFDAAPHLRSSIHAILASSSIDIGPLLGSVPEGSDRNKYAWKVYLMEYTKLIGGRLTGEL